MTAPVAPILPVDDDGIDAAIAALQAGQVVAIPTDTVYGVAVALGVDGATGRLFAAKQRPHDVDLPVLVGRASDAADLVEAVPPDAARLMERFWPGPLTLVLRRAPSLTADLGASSSTVGIRCPDHELVVALAAAVGPLATTSANLHRRPTPPNAAGVAVELGDGIALVLDGGRCEGAPSTVLDCTGDTVTVLREGRIPWPDIAAILTPPSD